MKLFGTEVQNNSKVTTLESRLCVHKVPGREMLPMERGSLCPATSWVLPVPCHPHLGHSSAAAFAPRPSHLPNERPSTNRVVLSRLCTLFIVGVWNLSAACELRWLLFLLYLLHSGEGNTSESRCLDLELGRMRPALLFAQKLSSAHLCSLSIPFLICIELFCFCKINWCFSRPFNKYYGPNSDLM